ncbi:hypothetical protein [Jatrophihabitans fulvus]
MRTAESTDDGWSSPTTGRVATDFGDRVSSIVPLVREVREVEGGEEAEERVGLVADPVAGPDDKGGTPGVGTTEEEPATDPCAAELLAGRLSLVHPATRVAAAQVTMHQVATRVSADDAVCTAMMIFPRKTSFDPSPPRGSTRET